jgi:phosphoglycerol transferase MdoB-like AlkP superfamily enzyme
MIEVIHNEGEFSVLRRCLYGKEVYEYVFEYAKDFWKKYKENRKFARLSFIEGHELTAEVIKYLDNPLYQFLNGFIEEGYLNNSSIIITSDHGLHYGIYVNTQSEDALIENFLPLLIFLLPNNRNNKIKLEELYINQDKFITPFDIYNTMIFIAEGNKHSNHNSKYGKSSFSYINPKGRNCLKYQIEEK